MINTRVGRRNDASPNYKVCQIPKHPSAHIASKKVTKVTRMGRRTRRVNAYAQTPRLPPEPESVGNLRAHCSRVAPPRCPSPAPGQTPRFAYFAKVGPVQLQEKGQPRSSPNSSRAAAAVISPARKRWESAPRKASPLRGRHRTLPEHSLRFSQPGLPTFRASYLTSHSTIRSLRRRCATVPLARVCA